MNTPSRRHAAPRLALAAALATLVAVLGCTSVEFYEKRAFSDPVMNFDEGPTEAHWLQKVYYSIEGAAGGFGPTAGGGCGCY